MWDDLIDKRITNTWFEFSVRFIRKNEIRIWCWSDWKESVEKYYKASVS